MHNFFPELDYLLSEYRDKLTFYNPESYIFSNTTSNTLSSNSFMTLIFGDTFPYASISFNFKKFSHREVLYKMPNDIKYRVNVFQNKNIFVSCDDHFSFSYNWFNINNEDRILFEELRKYKQNLNFDLNIVNYNNLSDIGKNVYNIFHYIINGQWITEPYNMNDYSLLLLATKIYANQLYYNNLKEQFSTFYTEDDILK